ncbi:hypothetical protein KAW65_01475 [candidate division WOR-3 bacterium]|nr:hypothetical protein [candidate division WOR-3 bacterium]
MITFKQNSSLLKTLLVCIFLLIGFQSFGDDQAKLQKASEWLSEARRAHKKEDYMGAIENFHKAAELFPEYAEAIAFSKEAADLHKKGEYDKAIASYRRASDILIKKETKTDMDNNYPGMLSIMIQNAKDQKIEKCLQESPETLKEIARLISSQEIYTLLILGRSLARDGNYVLAVKAHTENIDNWYTIVEAYYEQALAHYEGDLDRLQAVRDLREYVFKLITAIGVSEGEVRELTDTERVEVCSIFRKFKEVINDDIDGLKSRTLLFLFWGSQSFNEGDSPGAETFFNKAKGTIDTVRSVYLDMYDIEGKCDIEVPRDAEANYIRALAYSTLADYKFAAFGDSAKEEWAELWRDAISNVGYAISANPDYLEAYILRAKLYSPFYDKIADAELDYNKAVELAPDNPDVYYIRGMFYYKQQKFEQVVTDFEKYLSLAPDSPNAPAIRAFLEQIKQ